MEPEEAAESPAQPNEQDSNMRDKQEDDLLKSRTDKEIEEAEKRGGSLAEGSA